MDKIKLIEIKIDEHGNKIAAHIQRGSEKQWYNCQTVIEFICNGGIVDSAEVINNELCLVPSDAFASMLNTCVDEWYIQEYLGNKKFMCICSCGTIRAVSKYSLIKGESKSCGHNSNTFVDLTDTYINEWHILNYVSNQYWNCECSCGAVHTVFGPALRKGLSKSCGHDINQLIDLKNQHFGEWEVLEYKGGHKWLCRCSCGEEREIYSQALRNGTTTSCGHNTNVFIDLTDTYINNWHVHKYLGKGYWHCTCICGRQRNVKGDTLRFSKSMSCGRCNYTDEQSVQITNKDEFVKLIKNTYEQLGRKLLVCEVQQLLNVSESYAYKLVHWYDAEQYIEFNSFRSAMEETIAKFIESLGLTIERNNRSILNGKELDIYIPSKAVAIEINGSYWHNSLRKDKNYHFEKSLQCEKLGIQLIHIFDFEWLNSTMQQKIKNYLMQKLDIVKNVIYARDTIIKTVSNTDVMMFLNANHLQGYISSSICLGLYYNDILVQLMTFGIPRFSNKHDIEIYRLCTLMGTTVVGGASKLFKHFVKSYKPTSIVTYCDFSKFNGNVYEQLGMIFEDYTAPGYKYINHATLKSMSRLKCTKAKLIEKGWGTEDQTEEQIMTEKGYMKVYDCGNKRYVYRSTC